MGTPVKERMQKLRRKRQGRSLSVWIYPDVERRFRNIKTLTGQTNDAIVNQAIQGAYESIFLQHCHQVIDEIRTCQAQTPNPDPDNVELTMLYRKLVKILNLDYPTPANLKDALNKLEVPNYSGATGNWMVPQIRRLM